MGSSDNGFVTALEAGLLRCRTCGVINRQAAEPICRRCGFPTDVRRRHSLQRTWAFLLIGMMAYVPANAFPIMLTRSFSDSTSDTIFSGILELVDVGSYGVAAIVFVASICIPVAKFIIIATLALTLEGNVRLSRHARHRLHRITEFIGRWSMIDVFVVAVLAALIQLGGIITVLPGIGINAFAASVVFTMFAASSLDPRLIWDAPEPDTSGRSAESVAQPPSTAHLRAGST